MSLTITTLNTNGIRAGARKGLFTWLDNTQPDILCLQETKAQTHQLEDEIFSPKNYFRYFSDAEKKGYSGVAIYTKKQPNNIIHEGIGLNSADKEGRYLQIDYDNLSIVSLYLPSGTSGDIRQAFKYECLNAYEQELIKLLKHKKPYILCGDWNIAHQKRDLKNWRSNQKTSGFLPEERAWLDKIFNNHGFVDAFRQINQEENEYTWWSNRGQAWQNNVGWRIDYQIITPNLVNRIRSVSIYKEERFSDHAPLTITYDLQL